MQTTSEHTSIQYLRALCFCHTYHASVTFKHNVQLFMHLVMAKGSKHIFIFLWINMQMDILQTSTRGVKYVRRTANQHYIVEVIHRQKTPSFNMHVQACPPSQAYQLLTIIYLFLPSEAKRIWACLFINFRVVFEAHVILINRNHQQYSQSLVDKSGTINFSPGQGTNPAFEKLKMKENHYIKVK